MSESNSVFLKLTSALVVIGESGQGEVVKAGAVVKFSVAEAKNVLGRKKGVPATEDDGASVEEGVHADLSKLSKEKLLEGAEYFGIKDADRMTKAQLVDALEAARSISK